MNQKQNKIQEIYYKATKVMSEDILHNTYTPKGLDKFLLKNESLIDSLYNDFEKKRVRLEKAKITREQNKLKKELKNINENFDLARKERESQKKQFDEVIMKNEIQDITNKFNLGKKERESQKKQFEELTNEYDNDKKKMIKIYIQYLH